MIEVRQLQKTFRNGDAETAVLKGIDLVVRDGEFMSIVGRSGAGKSTLMYQMSLLDEPTGGDVLVGGRSTKEMTQDEEITTRLTLFGYVFQDYALLPELTAIENVALPLLMQGLSRREAYEKAAVALERVALSHRLHNTPSQLSGGEQQRVSIARAVAHSPKVLFADEPTANLDRESSGRVMEVFSALHKEGQTIIMVTHEEEYAQLTDRTVRLDDGRVVSITEHSHS